MIKKFILMLLLVQPLICFSGVNSFSECLDEGIRVDKSKINQLISIISKHKNELEKVLIRSQCYMKIGSYKHAIQDLDRVLEINPEYPYAHFYRGKAFFLDQNFKKAEINFKKSIELGNGNPGDYIFLARIYNQSGRYKDAKEYLEEALSIQKAYYPSLEYEAGVVTFNPDEVDIYIEYSKTLTLQEERVGAVKLLEEGFRRNNGTVELFNALMKLLVEIKDFEKFEKYRNTNCPNYPIKTSDFCKSEGSDLNK